MRGIQYHQIALEIPSAYFVFRLLEAIGRMFAGQALLVNNAGEVGYSLRAAQKKTMLMLSKQCSHFLLSLLCPPTSISLHIVSMCGFRWSEIRTVNPDNQK